MTKYMKPSEIRYCQDSVDYFSGPQKIGKTLDELCEGKMQISDLPMIRVCEKGGKWYTADNRRLWMFKHMERLGKLTYVEVRESSFQACIGSSKFTTSNDGESINVRGDPGGEWYLK